MLQNNRSIYKPRKYQKHKDSKERQKQDKEIRKKQREERHEEKRIEKIRQRKEDLSIQTNDHPLLDDLSDDDEFNGKSKYKITYYYLVNIIFNIYLLVKHVPMFL